MRQLLDLEPVWSRYDHFFVSEDSAISADLAKAHVVHMMPHYGLGQALIGKPFALVKGLVA